jgi:AcrR family transcriptional regulator
VGDVARAAGRSTGAIYDHFDSKQGLVFALVEEWAAESAAATMERLAAARSLEERLAALWAGTTDPAPGQGQWLTLELELWSCAQRDEAVLGLLRDRFAELWAGIEALGDLWPDLELLRGKAPIVMGVLTGMWLMRRVDPHAFTDQAAVAALLGAVTADPPRSDHR